MEVDAVVDGSAEAAPDTSRKRPAVDETDETDGDATVQGSQDARAPPSAADAPANRGKKKRSRKKRRIDGQQDVGTPPGGRTPGVKSPGSGRGKKGKHEKKHRPATVEIEKRDGDLKVKMLQDAILKALLSTFPQSSRIKIWGRINRVVVIQVDGLTAPLLIKHSAHWRGLTGRFAAAHPFQIPGNTGYVYDVGQNLFMRPLTETARKKLIREATKQHFTKMVLTEEQLVENGYPLASQAEEAGWVTLTEPRGERMFAVDCEMVLTEHGQELARCSVVDDTYTTLYDKMVLPESPIVDYVTKYSGITPELLEGVTTRLSDVQRELQELLGSDAVLVGHSLENDLRVLKLVHPWVIDTAVAFGGARTGSMKHGLKHLAQRCLGKDIQASTAGGGHNSVEDARTAMELVHKLLKDPAGCRVFQEASDPLCALLFEARLKSLLLDSPRPYIRSQLPGNNGLVTAPQCPTDADVVSHFTSHAHEHDFVWARLTELGESADPAAVDETAVAATGSRVTAMLSMLAPRGTDSGGPLSNTLVFVIGAPSLTKWRALYLEKKQSGQKLPEDKLKALQESVVASRQGLLFTGVNPVAVASAFGPR
eukprot:m.63852 g.63852  ORF g.63852 m.63852 type:complete len:596 (+) comp9685_c1_seq1:181-1968(+)